jgi:hypothetical protein
VLLKQCLVVQFLVRQPRGGRIAAEKMDLMNTVNQLLVEMNKLKEEKVALEEEVKVQRHSQVHDYVTHTVTARDIALAASNKVTHLPYYPLFVQEGVIFTRVDKMQVSCKLSSHASWMRRKRRG